jgi:hypothetical protein
VRPVQILVLETHTDEYEPLYISRGYAMSRVPVGDSDLDPTLLSRTVSLRIGNNLDIKAASHRYGRAIREEFRYSRPVPGVTSAAFRRGSLRERSYNLRHMTEHTVRILWQTGAAPVVARVEIAHKSATELAQCVVTNQTGLERQFIGRGSYRMRRRGVAVESEHGALPDVADRTGDSLFRKPAIIGGIRLGDGAVQIPIMHARDHRGLLIGQRNMAIETKPQVPILCPLDLELRIDKCIGVGALPPLRINGFVANTAVTRPNPRQAFGD